MLEAWFYKKLKDNIVQCELCPHFCSIKEGFRGKCGVRENKDGKLYSLVYGKLCSAAIDPIEKKPFFHFMPGSKAYSIATVGCNLRCSFCQNWEISQMPKSEKIVGKDVSPEEIVEDAIANNCESIAYTYTEPTVFFEYAYDIAKLAKKKGLKNVFVTNGFINKEPIDKIAKVIDAANIDLKGFSEDYYKDVCGARLKPILDAIKYYHEKGVFLEITTLIVPGHNDEKLKEIASFIVSIDKDIPWHISRFYPHYKMEDTKPTPVETIHKAVEIGKKAGLKYIYAGNVPGDDYESTFCSKCGKKIISRFGFSVNEINLDKNKCKFCGEKVNIVR